MRTIFSYKNLTWMMVSN